MNKSGIAGKWLLDQAVHPLRNALTDELHARPFESLHSPLDVFLIAKYTGVEDIQEDLAQLQMFCTDNQLDIPQSHTRHYSATLNKDTFRWERHGEFTTYTLFKESNYSELFSATPSTKLLEWIAKTQGELLVATHLSVRDSKETENLEPIIDTHFDKSSVVSSTIAGDDAQVVTDLKLHISGYNRIALLNHRLTPFKMGRVVQRLLDISTYRNMALLALPVARSTSQDTTRLDAELTQLLSEMKLATQELSPAERNNQAIQQDTEMLSTLTTLSMEIQYLSGKSQYRLSAAEAYYAIINSRISELNEQRVLGYQTIGEFLQRRLSPAMKTCQSAGIRLEYLSKRTARAVDLLRTRLDLALERQNHDLLGSMNKRAKLQMRLQETVEGLSIAAITYYFVGLIGYLAKSTKLIGLSVSPEAVQGISVIPVGLMVWFSVRQIKKKIIRTSDKSENINQS